MLTQSKGWAKGAGVAYFAHVATRADGPSTHVSGISALVVNDTGAAAWLYSMTGHHGGILSRDRGNELALTGQIDFVPGFGMPATPRLELVSLGGQAAVVAFGHTEGATGHRINSDGTLTTGFSLDIGNQTLLAFETLRLADGRDLMFTSTVQGAGLSSFIRAPDGRITALDKLNPSGGAGGHDVLDIGVIDCTSGPDYMVALSVLGTSLSSYRLATDGRATLTDTLLQGDGLPIAIPTLIRTLSIDGRDIVLLGAAGTSSITVLALSDTGRLVILDQVNDDRVTRFQGVSVMETAAIGDRVFVVAGGGRRRAQPDDPVALRATFASRNHRGWVGDYPGKSVGTGAKRQGRHD